MTAKGLRLRFWPDTDLGTRPQVDLWWGDRMLVGVRFGRPKWRIFSERYQGTHNIPRRFYYLFGGRLTIVKGRRIPAPTPEGTP